MVKNIIASLANGYGYSTKAELVCQCLNKELSGYGFYSYPSADNTAVLVNDDTMCKVLDFFTKEEYQPHITSEQVDRGKSILEIVNNNKINIFWQQIALKRKYYYLKQYGFHGWNMFNLLNLHSVNSAVAAVSITGAATINMTGIVALSWSSSLFLSSLENYIPSSIPRVKLFIVTTKFVRAAPIRCVEWSGNQILVGVEYVFLGHSLPTNITEVFKLNEGPKLKDLKELKKPILSWMVDKLQNLNK